MTQLITIDRATLEQLVGALEAVLDDSKYANELTVTGGVYEGVQCKKAITAGRAALANAEPTGWQKIETAPKDYVTEFDGWNGERVPNVSWAHPEYSSKGHYAWCVSEYENHNGWVNTEVKGLTHWMPLPAEPKEQS